MTTKPQPDVIAAGACIPGLGLARDLAAGGLDCLVSEPVPATTGTPIRAPKPTGLPNSSGSGAELNTDASLAILRPKVVGGGSVVNQALMDRFDDIALADFRTASGVDFFTDDEMNPYTTTALSTDLPARRAERANRECEDLRRRVQGQRIPARTAASRPGRLPLRGRQLLLH